jgi:4-amino-4-deoxy-L-arabinose transferase-like glycosyltransferase
VKRTTVAILVLTAAAFVLRLAYMLHSHPFIDEFATLLAARSILDGGLPVLPSGLFYEHGLLFSYLDAPFVALADDETLFTLGRLPSLVIGTATVPLLYWIGRRWLSPLAGLVAATLFVFSPEGIVWGGRARMYALAQLLVLLLAFLVYEGSLGEGGSGPRITPRKARWLALLTLLALLLTQFGALILVPPLLIGSLVVGWLTRSKGTRPWFARRAALFEGVGLIIVVGWGVLVKRLGRPLGAAPLDSGRAGGLVDELIGTVSYQAGLVLDGESTVKFLARQFGVPHHVWLTLIAVVGGLIALAVWLVVRRSAGSSRGREWSAPYSFLYLWLVFGLSVVEMILLLQPWRRNPRYLVMALPVFYLIVGGSVELIAELVLGNRGSRGAGEQGSRGTGNREIRGSGGLGYLVVIVLFVGVQAALLVPDLRVAYRTPEPAYEEAFRYVADQWEPGDVLLTMNTSGAGLLLSETVNPSVELGFAIQEDAGQFLLDDAGAQPVDRWLGAPWIGTAANFNRVLNEHRRSWFVIDTIRLPVYYRGDWLAVLETQMDRVWSHDDALVYLTRPDRVPVPVEPEIPVDARFGDVVALNGFSLARRGDLATEAQIGSCEVEQELCFKAGDALYVTLFWETLAPIDVDYTVFLHVRDEQGKTLAQRDNQPLDGLYPTSQWQPGESVTQPLDVKLPRGLPPGSYSLHVGLYRLDTMARLPLEDDPSGENAYVLDETIMIAPGEQKK